MLREFARWADIPVLNMEDDVYHPFQGLADILTVKEKFGGFKGVKFTMSWAYSPERPQAACCAAVRHPVCHHDGHGRHTGTPEGHGTGPEDPGAVQAVCRGSRRLLPHHQRLRGRGRRAPTWSTRRPGAPPPSSSRRSGRHDPKKTQEIFDQHKDWICTPGMMDTADKHAIYLHCLPVRSRLRSYQRSDRQDLRQTAGFRRLSMKPRTGCTSRRLSWPGHVIRRSRKPAIQAWNPNGFQAFLIQQKERRYNHLLTGSGLRANRKQETNTTLSGGVV